MEALTLALAAGIPLACSTHVPVPHFTGYVQLFPSLRDLGKGFKRSLHYI